MITNSHQNHRKLQKHSEKGLSWGTHKKLPPLFFFLTFPSSLILKGETTFLSYVPHLQSCVCQEDHTSHSLVTHHQEQKLFCHQGEAPKTPGASTDVKKVQLGIIKFASCAFTCRFFIIQVKKLIKCRDSGCPHKHEMAKCLFFFFLTESFSRMDLYPAVFTRPVFSQHLR